LLGEYALGLKEHILSKYIIRLKKTGYVFQSISHVLKIIS